MLAPIEAPASLALDDPQSLAPIRIHPAATMLPEMSEEEFDALVADIKAHGLLEPITLFDGAILDGRARERACPAAGVEPKFENWIGDDPVAFVMSKNLHRRQLSLGQRAMLAAEYATATVGGNHSANVPNAARSVADAAKLLVVSERLIHTARYVAQHAAPEIVAAVRAGEMNLNQAEKQIRQPTAPDVADSPSMRRQVWAETALMELRPKFKTAGYTVPQNIRIGFVPKNSSTAGYYCNPDNSSDGHHEIAIATFTDDGAEIIATLVHEMVHATVGLKARHGTKFRKCAELVGLEGKMTSTNASPRLLKWAKDFASRHGLYPGGALDKPPPSQRPRRSSPAKIGNWNQFLNLQFDWAEKAQEYLGTLSPDKKAQTYDLVGEIAGRWQLLAGKMAESLNQNKKTQRK